jgi:hypothetical protein
MRGKMNLCIGIVIACAIGMGLWQKQVWACVNQPDAPECPCFNTLGVGGAWDPAGSMIQDIAIDTKDTYESCQCLASTCSPKIDNSGQPYYQMVLGCNNEACASITSWAISLIGKDFFDKRQEWCSETVSYWHREADIPYPGGYRAGWHMHWQNYSVSKMRFWYISEDWHNDIGMYGGGRWIESSEVNYEDFELGRTVPVPGSYVAIRGYDYGPPERWSSFKYSHSLMIDEMWVHRSFGGEVCQIKVKLIEGNSGEKVKHEREWDDILSMTTQGDDWVGHSRGEDGIRNTSDDVHWKIYGFGVDINRDGEPIYDPLRLHWVDPSLCPDVMPHSVQAVDDDWGQVSQLLPATVAYAKKITESGGPTAMLSYYQYPSDVNVQSVSKPSPTRETQVGIPNGRDITLDFPQGSPPTELEIDLLEVHPLPIRGVELVWAGDFVPQDVLVEFAGDVRDYQPAIMPNLANASFPAQMPSFTVPVLFDAGGDGVAVRYVKLLFPSFPQAGTLLELRFLYEKHPWEDSAEVPESMLRVPIDIKPGSCPNPLNTKSQGMLTVAIVGDNAIDVSTIDPSSVRLEGVAPRRWSYEDAALPFMPILGNPDRTHCLAYGGRSGHFDGILDLVFHFKTQDVVAALGDVMDGEVVELTLKGILKEEVGDNPIQGKDRVWVLKKGAKLKP